MNRIRLLFLALLAVLSISESKSQTNARISKPELELKDNKVKIIYAIDNYKLDDKFVIWIEITDADGKLIPAKALSGDFGQQVQGGKGKQITWNYKADGITIKEGISVQVYGELITPSKTQTQENLQINTNSFSTGNIVLQSLILPGLGLSRATGQPHWLRGVAGYGCILSSIAYNQISRNNYNDYKTESDIGVRDDLFNSSVSQDGVSEAFAYAAIGIWVIDIVWNVMGSKNLNKQLSGLEHKLTITPSIEPVLRTPMLALSLEF